MDPPQSVFKPEHDEPEAVEAAIVQIDHFGVPTCLTSDTRRDDAAEIVLRE